MSARTNVWNSQSCVSQPEQDKQRKARRDII